MPDQPRFAHAVLTVGLALSSWLCTPATAQSTPIAWEALSSKGEWVTGLQDEQGVVRTPAGVDLLDGALAVRRVVDSGRLDQLPYSALRLSDGQVLAGGLIGFAERDGRDVVRWKHPGLGLLEVPMDRVACVQLDASVPARSSTAADSIVLRNGDTLEGFIEGFGGTLTIDVSGQKQEVELARVAAVCLVNTPTPRRDVRVWTADGSVIDGDGIEGGPGASFILTPVNVAPSSASLALLSEEVLAIERHPGRLTPLALSTPRVEASRAPALPRAEVPAPTRTDLAAPFSAATITIRGPQRLIYEVPKGFTILCADVAASESASHWTDCTLVVTQGGRVITQIPLSKESPRAQLRVPLQSGEFEIELDEGAFGPVGDSISLRRGLFIIPDTQG